MIYRKPTPTEPAELWQAVVPPAEPHVAPVDVPRLSEQSRLVLEWLSRGKCSSTELCEITHRFGARIHDLRRAGFTITTTEMRDGTGATFYELTGEPHA